MSMDNFTTKNTPITTHEHFCELVEDFDKRFGTQTYIGFDNLANIWKRFPLTEKRTGPHIEDYVHFRIVQNIKIGFKDKNRTQFRSEDYLRKTGYLVELHFFNSLYRYLIDIRAGKGLYGPMSISRFVNGNCQIHPGAHRIAMCSVYHQPVMYVLTDYTNPKKKKKLLLPRDTDFDWRRGRWALREMNYNSVYWQSTHREKKYKDIIDQLNDDDEHSFHHPQLADRHYVLDGDVVLVNNMPVCELVDDKWRVCCV